ncbi:MAG: hypothetical protein ACE5MI_08330 [Acidimicrobiia bacterium]
MPDVGLTANCAGVEPRVLVRDQAVSQLEDVEESHLDWSAPSFDTCLEALQVPGDDGFVDHELSVPRAEPLH